MNRDFKLKIRAIAEAAPFLKNIKRGIEKESLRIDLQGKLAQTPHPKALGSSLMHPMITTDYGEALLEFVTPPLLSMEALFQNLKELHRYAYQALDEEWLWAASMPPLLSHEDVFQIAEYGSSNIGKLKKIYRRGLGYRYGKSMQAIAGIHYNFSFSNEFWIFYHAHLHSKLSLQDFISEQYLHIARNCLRSGWLLPLFFGSSPACTLSFYPRKNPCLCKISKDTVMGGYASSLRLSDVGYQNTTEIMAEISYNNLSAFLNSMRHAVHTPNAGFSKIGVVANGEYRQLSDCILQIEDEHYALIRPKRATQFEERMLLAIAKSGIEYLEIRALDINPFLPLGLEPATVRFLDAFLLMNLLLESPPIHLLEENHIQANMQLVVLQGRKPGLKLHSRWKPSEIIALKEETKYYLENLALAAEILDKSNGNNLFQQSIENIEYALNDFEKLPSAQVQEGIQNHHHSFIEFGLHQSQKHAEYFKQTPLPKDLFLRYYSMAKETIEAQKMLESSRKPAFEVFLKDYLANDVEKKW